MVLINYPNTLSIFLTPRCNLKCSYCFVNKSSTKEKELDIEALKKSVDFFLKFPVSNKTISFSGGEPLLRFGKIRNLYQYLKLKIKENTKLSIALTSNGTLLTKNRYKFLEKNKINFKISIDGDRKFHDKNRPFKFEKLDSSYEQTTRNLKLFFRNKDNGYKVGASLVFTPNIAGDLLRNIKVLWKLGFDCIDFYPALYAQWSPSDLNRLEIAMRKFSNFYVSVFNSNKKTISIFKNSLLHNFVRDTELYKPILCKKVHLSWEGNFYYCDKVFSLSEPERKEFIIGNIDDGIDNRLRLRLLEQKRREIRKTTGTDCNVCKYLKYCFCPIGHYIYFSSKGINFKSYFPQFCRLSRIYINSFLEIKNNLKSHPLFIKIYNS